jgi:hypothetical protein
VSYEVILTLISDHMGSFILHLRVLVTSFNDFSYVKIGWLSSHLRKSLVSPFP